MSELVKYIKEIAGREVDTETYLKHQTLDKLTERHPVFTATKFLYRLSNVGELQDVLVAGFGNLNEMADICPTQYVNSGVFKLQFYAVTKNVPLVGWLGSMRAVDSAIQEIRDHSSFDKKYAYRSRIENKHVVLTASSNTKAGISFSSLATNIKRNGSLYTGDLVLSVNQNLGHGSKYYPDFMLSNIDTLKTLDVLSEKDSTTGELSYNHFQKGVIKAKKQIKFFANTFDINPDYNIWILTADNNI